MRIKNVSIMKQKLILILVILFTLMFNPTNVSRSATINMTQMEMDILNNELRINLLEKQINDEYSEFYSSLEKINSKTTKQFISDLACNAVNNKALPSIVIAQASLETGYGKYMKLGNNIFGIKGKGIITKTKEFQRGRFVTLYDEFQYFKSLDDAMARHFEIIRRYDFETRDYVEWAFKIKRGGYATDPNYPTKLIYIIQKFELDRLDRIQEMEQRLVELKNFNVLA
jgi:flagellum-specific peptidoglycan hydrolase FlgJ